MARKSLIGIILTLVFVILFSNPVLAKEPNTNNSIDNEKIYEGNLPEIYVHGGGRLGSWLDVFLGY